MEGLSVNSLSNFTRRNQANFSGARIQREYIMMQARTLLSQCEENEVFKERCIHIYMHNNKCTKCAILRTHGCYVYRLGEMPD